MTHSNAPIPGLDADNIGATIAPMLEGWKTRAQREHDVLSAVAQLGETAYALHPEVLRRREEEVGAKARDLLLTTWCRDCGDFPVERDGLCSGCEDGREQGGEPTGGLF